MNEYQRLLAFLKVMYHNASILHRNLVRDDAWFGNHKQIGKWYDAVARQIDDLAETGTAIGYLEPSIAQAVLAFSSDVLSVQPRGPEESFRFLLEAFRAAAGMMQAAESIVPASVANRLQEYEYFWNKETNFKIAAAIGEQARGGRMQEDDD